MKKTACGIAIAAAALIAADRASAFELTTNPQAYLGAKSSTGFVWGAPWPAFMAGVEGGITGDAGLAGGLRLMGAVNPPPVYGPNTAGYGFGGMADLRYHVAALSYMDFYPMLSAGFLAGVGKNGSGTQWFPLLEASLGTRIKLAPLTGGKVPLYFGIDVGLADFYIPFLSASVGLTFGDPVAQEAKRFQPVTGAEPAAGDRRASERKQAPVEQSPESHPSSTPDVD